MALSLETLLQQLYGWHGFLLIDQGFASHLGWSFALPALGHRFAGRRGLVLTALVWLGYAFFREFVEEAWEATRWSDIISRGVPALLLLVLEAVLWVREQLVIL